jgi:hypothetical protein
MIHRLTEGGRSGATIDEVAARVGRESEVRRVQMESLRWLVDLARRGGVKRLVRRGIIEGVRLSTRGV